MPIDQLVDSIQNINSESILSASADCYYSNKTSSYEMRVLYQSINSFVDLFQKANDAFITGNESEALIIYSKAYLFYQAFGNESAIGVVKNNMGNIHYKQKRYQEGFLAFSDSVQIIQQLYNRYLQKYLKFGIKKEDLLVDEGFKDMSDALIQRQFNLAEKSYQYLVEHKHHFDEETKILIIQFQLASKGNWRKDLQNRINLIKEKKDYPQDLKVFQGFVVEVINQYQITLSSIAISEYFEPLSSFIMLRLSYCYFLLNDKD